MFLQVRGGYDGQYAAKRSLDATQLPKDLSPTNEPLESIPVRLADLPGE